MKPEKLVMMANQIGAFFASQKGDEAVHGIADHLKKFWDPRMRSAILSHLEAGGEGLEPPVRRAVEQLAQEQKAHEPAKG
jgi:formate dehydrogenase subunit delta